jgi:Cu-processing system permease protein
MKKILILAQYTFLELVRQKMVLISLLVAFFLFLFSLVLGSLTFEEKIRVVTHVSLTVAHFSLIFMASLLGATLLDTEIRRQTCLLVLSRPVTRLQFLLGKILGIIFLVFAGWILLSICIHLLVWSELPILGLTESLFSIFLESILLLAFAVAASMFLRPAIAFLSVVGIYFLGHWLSDLKFFAEKSGSPMLVHIAQLMNWVAPHLEILNWRSVSLIKEGISSNVFGWALFHAFAWILFLIVVAYGMFRRKDLV